jgi:hypothetical protein
MCDRCKRLNFFHMSLYGALLFGLAGSAFGFPWGFVGMGVGAVLGYLFERSFHAGDAADV